jgi:hypothetical protein
MSVSILIIKADFQKVGTTRWGAASKTADDIPNLVEACQALGAR